MFGSSFTKTDLKIEKTEEKEWDSREKMMTEKHHLKKEEKDSNFHMKWFYGAHVTGWSAAVLNQIHLRSQQH